MENGFKSLAKGASILGVARVVEFFFGLVKIKINALFIGVSGVGVYNQASFFSQKLMDFTSLSTSEGLVKQLAQNSSNENSSEIILSAIKTYIVLVSIFMTFSSILLTFFSSEISEYIFGEGDYLYAFLICLACLPILIANSIPYSLMRAFQDVVAIAKVRVLSCVLNIIHSLPLIYFYGLKGAVFSIFFGCVVTVILNFYFSRKLYFLRFNITFRGLLKVNIDKMFVRELVQFSGFGVTIGVYVIVSEFICRSIVVEKMGVEAIGLYSPNVMWATLFTGFLVPALTTYLFSSLCAAQSNTEISQILNNGIRLASLALMPLLFIAIPFKELVIVTFYSQEFVEAAKYLPFHLLGVVFQVWFSVLGKSMASTGRIKQHGIFRFVYLSIDILVTYVCVREWGLWGWTAKYVVSPTLFFFVYFMYCYRNMGFRLLSQNFILMIYAFGCASSLIVIDHFFYWGGKINYVIGPIFLVSVFFVMNTNERTFIITRVTKYIR